MKKEPNLKRPYFVLLVLIYAGCFLLFDFLAGKLLFNENTFRDYPLPPYDILITDNQKKNFEKLGEEQEESYIVFDHHLGWTIGESRTVDDSLYVSNSAGIRSFKEYDLEKPDSVIRIAAFGDSYTEAVDVKNVYSWPYLLENSGDNLEVLNFGVRAYGTDQAYMRYKREGVKYNADVVLIGFLVENIRRNVNQWRPAYEHNTGGLGVKPRFIIQGDSLQLVPNPIQSPEMLRQEIIDKTLLNTIGKNDYWYQKYKFAFGNNFVFHSNFAKLGWLVFEKLSRDLSSNYGNRNGELFQVSSLLLKKFYEDALSNGATHALVLIFPGKMHLDDFAERGKKVWQPLLTYFEKEGIEYLDCTDTLMQHYGGDKRIVYGHYTELGNSIIKDMIFSWLQQNYNVRKK